MSKQCFFITVEGSEGAGKSTAMRFISQYLQSKKQDVLQTREPGGTPVAEAIRNILLHQDGDEVIDPKTELLLMYAARRQHVTQCIIPALQAGKTVLSDRFVDASYAYQGGARGLPLADLKALDTIVLGDLQVDLTILLDLPVEQGFERTKNRKGGPDRIEREKQDFFEKVRQSYLERAKNEPQRIFVVDASLSLRAVEQQIQQVLDQFLGRVGL